jgi:hypothetical protein
MVDQKYVYTVHKTEAHPRKLSGIDSVINEHAREGWRLVDTMERDGTTIGLIFEQER